MGVSDILASVDYEIAQLLQARAVLTGGSVSVVKRGVGRPRKIVAELATVVQPKKKRNLSPEGRKRIAEAVKRRWATQKKAAGASAK